MKLLYRLLLLLLVIALPFNVAMAGLVQQEEVQGRTLPVSERVSFHERCGTFGTSEWHPHKAGDRERPDGYKPSRFVKYIPSVYFLFHSDVPSSAVWNGGDEHFPNDHAPAPPELLPKTWA